MKKNMAANRGAVVDTIEIPDEVVEVVARALVRYSWSQFEEQPSSDEKARGVLYKPGTPNARCRDAARAAIEAMLESYRSAYAGRRLRTEGSKQWAN